MKKQTKKNKRDLTDGPRRLQRLVRDGTNLAVKLSRAMRLLESAQQAAARDTWTVDNMDVKINRFFHPELFRP